jgi:hypothetical protein
MMGAPGRVKSSELASLDLAAVVIEQGARVAADAEIEFHARVGRIFAPHPLAFFLGDHFQRQFIVVAQEGTPLTIFGDGGVRRKISIMSSLRPFLSAI